MRDDILTLALEPGAALRLPSLSERYGIGVTPLRDCLNRLSTEKLVVVEHNKGFRVSALTTADLLDLERSRNAIEGALFARAVEDGDDAWEAGVIGTYHQLSRTELPSILLPDDRLARWTSRHAAFHDALIAGAPSHWMTRFRTQLNDHLSRYQRYIQSGLRQMAGTRPALASEAATIFETAMALAPHTALYRAALDRNATAARQTIEAHARLSITAFENLIALVATTPEKTAATRPEELIL